MLYAQRVEVARDQLVLHGRIEIGIPRSLHFHDRADCRRGGIRSSIGSSPNVKVGSIPSDSPYHPRLHDQFPTDYHIPLREVPTEMTGNMVGERFLVPRSLPLPT
jgi:hypothetical protein